LFSSFLISFSCFGLLGLLTMKCQFWPFTDVLREIWLAVTRKMEIFLNRRKPRQRSIYPDRARRKTVLFSSLPSVKAVWRSHYGAIQKKSARRFFTSGRKLV